jgi:hypothetical protein
MTDPTGIREWLTPTIDPDSQMLHELAMIHFGAAAGVGVGGSLSIGWVWVAAVAWFAAGAALLLWAGERT